MASPEFWPMAARTEAENRGSRRSSLAAMFVGYWGQNERGVEGGLKGLASGTSVCWKWAGVRTWARSALGIVGAYEAGGRLTKLTAGARLAVRQRGERESLGALMAIG